MKLAYPIVISKEKKFFVVYVPDCRINTQGDSIVDAIEMARDAISLWCMCTEDDFNRPLPTPSELSEIAATEDQIVTLVDVDIDAYRRKYGLKTVRKNLTIPQWLNEKAEKQRVNFSRILQDALIDHLNIDLHSKK